MTALLHSALAAAHVQLFVSKPIHFQLSFAQRILPRAFLGSYSAFCLALLGLQQSLLQHSNVLCAMPLQDVKLPSISRLEGQELEVPAAAAEATPEASGSGGCPCLPYMACWLSHRRSLCLLHICMAACCSMAWIRFSVLVSVSMQAETECLTSLLLAHCSASKLSSHLNKAKFYFNMQEHVKDA